MFPCIFVTKFDHVLTLIESYLRLTCNLWQPGLHVVIILVLSIVKVDQNMYTPVVEKYLAVLFLQKLVRVWLITKCMINSKQNAKNQHLLQFFTNETLSKWLFLKDIFTGVTTEYLF